MLASYLPCLDSVGLGDLARERGNNCTAEIEMSVSYIRVPSVTG